MRRLYDRPFSESAGRRPERQRGSPKLLPRRRVLGARAALAGAARRGREMRALAIAQVGGQHELIARVLAGRGVAPEAVDRYLDPTLRDLMPDPFVLRDIEAATAAVEGGGRCGASGSRSSATTTSTARAARRSSANFWRRAAARRSCTYPIAFPRVWAQRRGDGRFRRPRREPRRHRRLRRGEPWAVRARRKSSASTSSCLDHHQAPETLPEALAMVDPDREDDLSGLGYLSRSRRRLSGARRPQPGVARRRLLERRARRPTSSPRSTSSRSPRSPTWCR